MNNDVAILRELAKEYTGICADSKNEERRKSWSRHLSKKDGKPLVYTLFGMCDAWCQEEFGRKNQKCVDPVYKEIERQLRMKIFHASIGDDSIAEPWISVSAFKKHGDNVWGLKQGYTKSGEQDGAYHMEAAMKSWDDMKKLRAPEHQILEKETKEKLDKIQSAVGDLITIDLNRAPVCQNADFAEWTAQLRGLQQIMMDMYDEPEKLHALHAFMRDAILANQEQAEKAGDYSATSPYSQCPIYSEETPWPKPNQFKAKRENLWGYCATQEYTLVSPDMHDEFLIQYQLPILKKNKFIAYGCCENLTNKIDILRKIPNLMIIAVTPSADVKKCAERIQKDYVISWRPNPAAMVSVGFDESRVRKIISEGLETLKGTYFHINLKDIHTVEGDVTRLPKWAKIVREEISKKYS
ncbi:MAG: hypothetical protein A2297_06355 [Elusimicrobia bacterium RIFOXYB2_FULL_48_7]|nr:MAG: hypothetical protein A2297_06355 [Elusimicrobia bacterium RIFOXYB2_FULL_48_7]